MLWRMDACAEVLVVSPGLTRGAEECAGGGVAPEPSMPHFGLIAAALLAAVFLLLNLVLVALGGMVRLGGDSPVYIRGADLLRQGHLFAGRPGLWLGYASVIALWEVVGIGLRGVVATQLVAAALAGLAQYDLGRQLGGRWVGLLVALFLVANPDIARWHTFIMTDSLYTSLVVLVAWAAHRAAERRGGWYILAGLLVLGAGLMRPEGLLLLPLAASYWLIRALPRRGARWLAVGGVAGLFILGVLTAPFARAAVQFEEPLTFLQRGDIVSTYTGWLLPMPAATTPAGAGQLGAVAEYVARHPLATVALAGARMGAELIHIRPFYSARHNLAVLACLLPLYLLALLGIRRVWGTSLAKWLLALIGSHLPMAALLGANWDGRYLLFFLPLILVFSACELGGWLRRVELVRPWLAPPGREAGWTRRNVAAVQPRESGR